MMEIITIIAIFLGPIIAVILTRYIDDRRFRRQRRMDLFRTLMRTRRIPIHVDHVGALNLIEIEFRSENHVMTAWKDLLTHLGTDHGRRQDEIPAAGATTDEQNTKDSRFWSRLTNERQRLLAKLLHAMAKVLKFKIEQLEVFEGGYTPQGWVEVDDEQQQARRFLIDLSTARKVLPVYIANLPTPPTSPPGP